MDVLGVGVDAVDVPRFAKVLDRRPRLAQRLFSEAELAYAARHTDPAPRLAARFAAKEAVMKSLGVGLGGIDLRDVEVARGESGAPELVVTGRAAGVAGERGVERWQLSLTHTETVALAFVVALGTPTP